MRVCVHGCVYTEVWKRQEQRQEDMNRNEKLFFFLGGKEPEITSVQKYPASLTDKYSDMGRCVTE